MNSDTQKLAERIAALLQENEKGSDDSAFIRQSLERINQRLDKIESQISFQNPQSQITNHKSFHVSQEKFENLEDLADQIISSMPTEKACPFEPTGKPCDHCAMCNSRGF